DRLERNEEDPERLDNLFRLDHLAARLRRNSANLLVLAGAQITRDQREPVPLSTVINAAVSEVEDYRRVQIGGIADCTVIGAAAGAVIHLLAELIDNALRYSPPTTTVRVSAVRGSEGGVLMRIADAGLGMTDTDRRMANMRLQAGGDVTPDNARHMGLFVVGRLASRHGIRVGLRGPSSGESGTGTTAEVYLPLPVLVEGAPAPPAQTVTVTAPPAPPAPEPEPATAPAATDDGTGQPVPPVTLLPRRNPGTSGITDVPAQPVEEQRPRRELPTPWWESGAKPQSQPAAKPAPAKTASDTSAFFGRRPAGQPTAPPGDPAERGCPAARGLLRCAPAGR
ncbi:sensor histidine kinase KdpD, partial [Mycobacterium sp. 1423905.2]|uniref:sensor histidine kinase n=1 Tax=Mycobacterium sp. 1423905.2 TaxID=1856859 RepID=UPI000B131A1C